MTNSEVRGQRLHYVGPSTFQDAGAWVRVVKDAGAVGQCPLCDSIIHVVKRNLRLALVLALRHVQTLDRPVVAADMKLMFGGKAPNDWHMLAYWEFLRNFGKHWVITDLGRQFLAGTAQVPRHVFVEHGAVVGKSQDLISIREIDLKGFSLDAVMASWNPEALATFGNTPNNPF